MQPAETHGALEAPDLPEPQDARGIGQPVDLLAGACHRNGDSLQLIGDEAARVGDVNAVYRELLRGIHVDQRDQTGAAALHVAAQHGQLDA